MTRPSIRGPTDRLEPRLALRLARVIHELGTSSAKHGALSVADGAVDISWTVRGTALHLQWVERGGEVQLPTQGIVWEIDIPLSRADHPEDAHPSTTDFAGFVRRRKFDLAALPAETPLEGKRILVVEDEPLVATALADSLAGAGARVKGPAGTSDEALRLIENTALDGALLDAKLHGHPVDELAAALTWRNVPFVFVTGYGRDSLPREFRDATVIAKPFRPEELLAAVRELMRPGDSPRP